MRGRKLSFHIALTDDERPILEGWQRSSKVSVGQKERGAVILLFAEGLAEKDVAARSKMTEKTVRKWARRFERERMAGLADLKRSGRPRVFPP